MSVSVSILPFLLIYSICAGANIINSNKAEQNNIENLNIKRNVHIDNNFAQEIFNKTFETQIMDKELLLKTLKEHGAINIQEENDNITCNCEAFHLYFHKTQDKPYFLEISYNEENSLNEFVQDIGNEYTLNAQEISYNQIKERLAKQNLEIEEEEIFDDNTIVLTVNLE